MGIRITEWVRLLRPHQWVKSGFVFSGYFFVERWSDPDLTMRVVVAAGAFSLIASAVYIFNDLGDRQRDRQHPEKQGRPLAAGTVSPRGAMGLMGVVSLCGLWLGFWVSLIALLCLFAYLLINILYGQWLKHVVILDVFAIASGFILRIMVGTLGVGIPPSKWLLLCGIMLALFLGFGKRHAELMATHSSKGVGREVLADYSDKILESMLTTTSAAVLVTYALYTVDESTVRVHHTEALIYTVPIVAYGLFRYLYLLHHHEVGQDTSWEIFSDRQLLLTVFIWLLTVLLILR